MNINEISFWMMIATAVMAFFTFISIIINIYLSNKSREISQSHLEEMEKNRKETNRANVVAYFKVEGNLLNFVLQNVGLSTASYVEVNISPLPPKING